MSSNNKDNTKGVMGAMAQSGAANTERRRSSASSGQKFAKLHNQKRSSQDAGAAARKQSFAEQSASPGIFGSMWNSFTKGGK